MDPDIYGSHRNHTAAIVAMMRMDVEY